MDADDTNKSLGDLKEETKDDIFSALDVEGLDEDEKALLLTQMLEIIETRVLTKIVENISDEEKAELDKLTEEDDPEALDDFLQKTVPELPQLFQDEADRLRQELLIKFAK